MTLRLGFCGVGRWARKLAESFRACGAEVVAFDRGTVPTSPLFWPPGFGVYIPWRDQLADKSIDAIVAVAPPEVTTEVAMACAAAGRPVLATKPLFDHPERITAPFYVDFWRLWASAHQDAKREEPKRWEFRLSGSGPFRSFPGAFDYGPHVMAAALDVGLGSIVACERGHAVPPGELFTATLAHEDETGAYSDSVRVEFGNGNGHGDRYIWGHVETPTHIGSEPKEAIMQKFCRSFLSDVSEGFVSTDLLSYSREGMRLLREIGERAK